MAGDDSLPATSFDDIELHKENIQPLASGRSAKALAQVLSARASPVVLRGQHAVKQAEFEKELKTATELDDPLEVWVRYVNWTIETFPSGNSRDSGLLRLLERVTREFLHEEQYKNDPRYLKLWIQYIQNHSDAPREVFAYVARHDIGQRLALFYEEFAALLESTGRKNQAAEIYHMGIENNARPVDRLVRKFDEFKQRLEQNPPTEDEPSSPALRAVRPALAAKPLGGGLGEGLSLEPQQQQQQPAPAKRPARQKMAVFSDADAGPSAKAPCTTKETAGWEEIGTRDHRRKENTIEAKPFAGQTLKQEGGKKSSEGGKLMVFRDTSLPPQSQNSKFIGPVIAIPGKRPERVAINLNLVYPEESNDEEFSFEELRAIGRGLYGIDWNARREDEAAEQEAEAIRRKRIKNQENPRVFEERRAPITVKTVMSPSPNKSKIKRKGHSQNSEPTMTFHTRAATDEIYDIFNQPLQLSATPGDDGSGSEDEGFDGEDYTMATQVGEQAEQFEGDDDDAGSVKSEWSDFTLRQNIPAEDEEGGAEGELVDCGEEITEAQDKFEKLAIHKGERLAVFHDEPDRQPASRLPVHNIRIPSPPENFDPPRLPYNTGQSQNQNRLPYMTPIVEKTESLPSTAARRKAEHAKTPSRSRMPNPIDDGPAISNPFSEIINDSAFGKPLLPSRSDPPLVPKERERKPFGAKPVTTVKPTAKVKVEPIIQDLQCNPMDEAIRTQIYEKLSPPLKTYEGFYQHMEKFNKAAEIRKYSKAISRKDSEKTGSIVSAPVIDFVTGDGGSSYIVKRELGKGAFAPVYLAENNTVADAEDEMEELDEDNTEGRAELAKSIVGRERFEAIKMEHPPSPWEFYIMRQSIRRLGVSRASESIIPVHEMHLFPDEGYLILAYRNQGTILDLINMAKKDSASAGGAGVMDEVLVMFLSVELLRTVEALHTRGILHGDLKADNCLLRFEPLPDTSWSARYRRDGSDGWDKKGISLIDFGRGIDMRLFHPNVQFIADWKTDAQDCAEMREMRPWTYQIDYHGLAAIIHSMLFGKYIDTAAEVGGLGGGAGARRYRITSTLKRYWQTEIWNELFDVLLNPGVYVGEEASGAMPVGKSLRQIREEMEKWLEGNCEKGVGLKAVVKRMEGVLARRK